MNSETLIVQIMVVMVFGFAGITMFCAWRSAKFEEALQNGTSDRLPTLEESWYSLSKGLQSVTIFAIVIFSIFWLFGK